MLKKLFFIGVISMGAYFTYGFLPASWKDQGKAAVAGINFGRFSPANLLPELRAKAEPYREKLIPESPVKKREELIGKLSTHLETIAENQNPKTAKERLALKTAATESKTILAELKEENPKSGIMSTAFQRVIEKVLPASTTTNPVVCQ